jgi:cytochrome c-type biogenesis protein CcmH
MLGSPGVESAEAHSSPLPAPTQKKAGSVDDLVDGLRAKMEKNPEDGSGWMLLARSYDHLGRHADAIDAYEQAQALGNLMSEPNQ